MKKLSIVAAIATLLIWAACNKESGNMNYSAVPLLPETAYKYVPEDVPNWIRFAIMPGMADSSNQTGQSIRVTDAGATLGRVLFYDKAMSLNNSVACGSCHKQQFAFADPKPLSSGLMPGPTKRNSPHIVNLFDSQNFFWDGRSHDLKEMVMMPVRDHIEMGFENIENLPKKLNQLDYYAPLFTDAFGDANITTDRIAIALTQFVKSIISYNSPYDRQMNGSGSLSSIELEGKRLFFEKYNCGGCHVGNNFGAGYSDGVANIGLDVNPTDKGAEKEVFVFTGGDIIDDFNDGMVPTVFVPTGDGINDQFDMSGFETRMITGAFKIAPLRNVALTAPYMHDGRFKTLEEVIEHYSTGIKANPSLDARLEGFEQNGGMHISDFEKKALVAFLNSLTDYSIVNEPRFSDPFVVK